MPLWVLRVTRSGREGPPRAADSWTGSWENRWLKCNIRKRLQRAWGQIMEVLVDALLPGEVRRQQRALAGIQQGRHLMERVGSHEDVQATTVHHLETVT